MSADRDLTALLGRAAGKRVLCVGDVMLDVYVYGRVERVSPEAPVPVLRKEQEIESLGAVGNVARNVAALGGDAFVASLIGADDAARRVTRLLAQDDAIRADLIADPERRTTVKTRAVAGGQQLLRIDEETPHVAVGHVATQLMEAALAELPQCDAVAVSDYAKGALPASVLTPLIETARAQGKPVVVDPKGRDFGRYRGATLVKPNGRELAVAAGRDVNKLEDVEAAAQEVVEECGLDALLVTLSERGMALVRRGAQTFWSPAQAREVFDVSGAGDTGLAALALCLAADPDLEAAASLANAACGVAVTKAGAAAVSAEEVLQAVQLSRLKDVESKVFATESLMRQVDRWRSQGLEIGFTNGCFDLVHPGHVSLLRQARAACDRLIVGLNTDASVRRLKGPERPVNDEAARAVVLASLADVDAVTFFGEDTPIQLIQAIRPDVLVKGADYREDQVVGADVIKSYGGRVLLATLVDGVSTTRTIARMAG